MFFNDNVFLTNGQAKKLYPAVKDLPVFDYHCHLSPKEIYQDRSFSHLTDLWLAGDHYKWRLMRAKGIDERYITGDGGPYEKFLHFAKALPDFAGNPVYHWAHLELKTYFGITAPINAENAQAIWEKTQSNMANGGFSARAIIKRTNVRCIITTDDPTDTLDYHKKLKDEKLSFAVLPCFRPDKAVNIENCGFTEYIGQLSQASGIKIDGLSALISALNKRLGYFIENGCVSADISFTDFPLEGNADADMCLKRRLSGGELSSGEEQSYKFAVICALSESFAQKNIVMQLHTGVLRNCNSRLFKVAGADAGGDSVGGSINITAANKLLDTINTNSGLPKTIIYTLNPAYYYPLATLLGDFAAATAGRLQLGAAWWFCDHRDGITEQLRLTAATGGLGLFNGMLTDSRSFTSFVRHDYFRRILCSLLGEWALSGEYPESELERIAKNISYYNAEKYFLGG